MPSAIFTHLNVIDVVSDQYDSGFLSSRNFVDINFGTFSINGSGSDESEIPGTNAFQFSSKTGTVDFQDGPSPVPETALITQVRVRTPVSVTASANLNQAGENGRIQFGVTLPASGALPPPNRIIISENTYAPSPINEVWNESYLGADADVIFDYSSSPIDYDTLVANHGTQVLTIGMAGPGIQVAGTASTTSGTADFYYNIVISDWEIEVEWGSGSAFAIAGLGALTGVGEVVIVDPGESRQPLGVNAGVPQTVKGPAPATVLLSATLTGNYALGTKTFAWTQDSGPIENVSISTPGALATQVTFSVYQPGTYRFRITVRNLYESGMTFEVYDTVLLAILPTVAPQITNQPQVIRFTA